MPFKDKNKSNEWHRLYNRMVWRPKNKDKVQISVKKYKSSLKEKLIDYKLSHGCQDCGYNKCAEALEFDHLKDKKYNISQMPQLGLSWQNILKEIEKCELVCANCHRERTIKRRGEV